MGVGGCWIIWGSSVLSLLKRMGLELLELGIWFCGFG